MVVAGIPPPKDQSVVAQNRHVDIIANVALSMRKFLTGFEIPHRRKERVKKNFLIKLLKKLFFNNFNKG